MERSAQRKLLAGTVLLPLRATVRDTVPPSFDVDRRTAELVVGPGLVGEATYAARPRQRGSFRFGGRSLFFVSQADRAAAIFVMDEERIRIVQKPSPAGRTFVELGPVFKPVFRCKSLPFVDFHFCKLVMSFHDHGPRLSLCSVV